MKVAFITGISGFLGRHLAAALRARGVRVAGMGNNLSSAEIGEGAFRGDVTDRARVAGLVDRVRPDTVFHLAASKSRTGGIEEFRQAIEVNLIGTLNLAEACVGKPDLERFVAIGTCEEYGHSPVPFREDMRESPISAYSFSKTAATHLVQTLYRRHRLPAVVLRPSLAYGPGQAEDMFLPALIKALLAGNPFAMSGGQQTRDYVYVDDLVDAMVLAGTSPGAPGGIFNISSGAPVSLRELALLAAGKIGPTAAGLIRFGEKQYRQNEIMDYRASYGAAERVLGWKPRVSLDEGLGLTIENYRRSDPEAR